MRFILNKFMNGWCSAKRALNIWEWKNQSWVKIQFQWSGLKSRFSSGNKNEGPGQDRLFVKSNGQDQDWVVKIQKKNQDLDNPDLHYPAIFWAKFQQIYKFHSQNK